MTRLSHTAKDDRGRHAWRTDGRLVVSYPKSGRTWLRFALSEGGIDATFTHAGASTNRREIGRPYRAIPKSLLGVPVVFLHRDPIDTAVSMFYQVTRRDLRRYSGRWFRLWLPLKLRGALPPPEIDAFVLDPIYGVAKVCAYNRLWLDHLDGRGDCLVLTYEAMRADSAAGFQRLLDHWRETGSDGEKLAQAASFERMKRVEQSGTAPLPQLRAAQPGEAEAAKVRKGKVRGYLDELRPETIAQCRKIARSYGFAAE